MTGRRPTNEDPYTDNYLAVPAIVDIDGDGKLEIITGNRIHKFNISDTLDHRNNTYTTMEGPVSVTVPEGKGNGTYYLNDGYTRVADIDGDGVLDIIVVCSGDYAHDDDKIIVYVWDTIHPGSVKACVSFGGDTRHGSFSIPFIGDINGKLDGWNGSDWTKKLPEICILSGGVYINRANTVGDRTGIKFHPKSDVNLRRGAGSNGWDNNDNTTANRRFNRGIGSGFEGHIIGLTWDDSATLVEEKLKISWGMEHADASDQTGLTLFDFDNNNTADLCYRDEKTLRVISPGKSQRDYVELNENTTSPNTSVMFSTPVYSGTAFEYPVIADVNMDGSADIVVTNTGITNNQYSGGWVEVYEYVGTKWAPCPPVWNQGMYDPTMVREDLKINARPIPMLTAYTKNNKTVYPYNGSWMQVPIVSNEQDFVPVVRQPDAVLRNVRVNIRTTEVTVDIFNNGTATLAANTPISFYNGGTSGLPIESSSFIKFENLGVDVFPNTKITQTYTISGDNYNNCLIWVRVMANNNEFPALGFDDCDLSNNTFAGIDCPYLNYSVEASSTVICGNNSVVRLKAIEGETPHYTPIYQWYKDEMIIQGANSQIYFATTPGSYKCYVIENVCRGYSSSVTITGNNDLSLTTPNLVTLPANGKLCVNGNVMMKVNNFTDYTGATYIWLKDDMPFDTTTLHYINIPHSGIPAGQEEGVYQVFVMSNGCSSLSNKDSIHKSTNEAVIPSITKKPTDAVICGNNGSVLLQITNLSEMKGSTFQWYRDAVLISGATDYYYFATETGVYSVNVNSANGCSTFSNDISLIKNPDVNITRPIISRDPAGGDLCTGGSVLLKVTNVMNGYNYFWYKAGELEYIGSGDYTYVTSAGRYYVLAIDGHCTSNSAEINILSSPSNIITPEIESSLGGLNINMGSSIHLRLKTPILGATAYQWYRNGDAIVGAANITLVVTEAGQYSLKVTTADCYAFSDGLTVTSSGINMNQTTSGKDFWLAFGRNGKNGKNTIETTTLQIKIVTTDSTDVSLVYTDLSGNDKIQNISIPADAIYTIDLNSRQKDAVYTTTSKASDTLVLTNKSVHIITSVPVSVYALNSQANTSDATNVFPSDVLGMDHYHISYKMGARLDAMLIVATEDNTTVTEHNLNISRLLRLGQVFYYQSQSDMTGHHITSDKPVAFFAAHQGAMIPDGAENNFDNLFQQLAPVHSWGKHFLVPDIDIPEQYPLRLRIVASQNGTSCQVKKGNITTPVSLNAGKYYETTITSSEGCYVSSDKPIAVCSYLLSYSNPKKTPLKGGPAQVWIPPVEQTVASTTISPFYTATLTNHYAFVITPTATKDQTTVITGGISSSLSGATWMDNSGYSFTKYALANAPYTFSNQAGVIVLVAGIVASDSYYMLAGAAAHNLNMMFTVNGVHYEDIAEKTLCSGTISLAATIQYAKNPLELKWFINNTEVTQARNQLTCDTILPAGTYTVSIRVIDLNNLVQTISTDFTIELPVVVTPEKIYTGDSSRLSPSTGGSWTSSNPAIATIDNNGLVRGLAEGKVQFTFTSAAGCSTVSDTVNIEIRPVKALNDTVPFVFNNLIKFDALANDMFVCDKSQVAVSIIAGSGLDAGNLVINPDKTFTYTPNRDVYGIDSVKYSITCGNYADTANIYFVISKPLSLNNVACPQSQIAIGMHAIPNVQYYWYDVPTGGNLLFANPSNKITFTKDNSVEQSWYMEARYKGESLSARYKMSVFKSDNCGTVNPSGCIVDGQLLFREDFGVNTASNPRVSPSALSTGVTDYIFQATDQLKANQYALVKYIDPASDYAWQKNFSDHSCPNDITRGYMFLVDASDNSGKFYETRITGLCDNIDQLYFSVWVANVIPTNNTKAIHNPKLKFELIDDSNNVIGTYVTDTVPRDPDGSVQWRNYGFTFNPDGYSSLKLKIYNNETGSKGNDFALDDIEIYTCGFPEISITAPVNKDTVICSASSFTFDGNYIDDGTFGNNFVYRWEHNPTTDTNNPAAWKPVTPVNGTTNSDYTINSVSVSHGGYYRLAVSDAKNTGNNNCRVVSDIVHLKVIERVVSGTVTGNDTICYSAQAPQLSSTPATGGSTTLNYQWQESTDGIAWTNVATGTGSTTLNYTPPRLTQTTFYRVVVTSGTFSCETTYSNVVQVTVMPLPLVSVITTELCTGLITELIPETGTNGAWTSDKSSVVEVIDSKTAKGISSGTATLTYTSSATGCSSEVGLTVKDFPLVEEITGDKIVCIGESVQLSNVTPNGVWTHNNANIDISNSTTNPATVKVTGVSAGKSYVSYTVFDGVCKTTQTFKLKIIPNTPLEIKIGIQR
ncbi:MAG: Ig-like domain-containing protein [Bacteroidales bacterium]|jgi:hypothetical protein|nr:Ig-like domain-containing protein [Bacteroidales bacterium]